MRFFVLFSKEIDLFKIIILYNRLDKKYFFKAVLKCVKLIMIRKLES